MDPSDADCEVVSDSVVDVVGDGVACSAGSSESTLDE